MLQYRLPNYQSICTSANKISGLEWLFAPCSAWLPAILLFHFAKIKNSLGLFRVFVVRKYFLFVYSYQNILRGWDLWSVDNCLNGVHQGASAPRKVLNIAFYYTFPICILPPLVCVRESAIFTAIYGNYSHKVMFDEMWCLVIGIIYAQFPYWHHCFFYVKKQSQI